MKRKKAATVVAAFVFYDNICFHEGFVTTRNNSVTILISIWRHTPSQSDSMAVGITERPKTSLKNTPMSAMV